MALKVERHRSNYQFVCAFLRVFFVIFGIAVNVLFVSLFSCEHIESLRTPLQFGVISLVLFENENKFIDAMPATYIFSYSASARAQIKIINMHIISGVKVQ